MTSRMFPPYHKNLTAWNDIIFVWLKEERYIKIMKDRHLNIALKTANTIQNVLEMKFDISE
jgi:hypothetical protein